MFKQIDFGDAAGKTIRAVVACGNDDELIISFTDETFAFIRATTSYEDLEIETHAVFSALDHRLDLILEPAFGELAKPMHDEARAERDARDAKSRQETKERRRLEYERLKQEFGDTPFG